MASPAIGLLSPGDMGHAVGSVLRANGLTVLTSLHGRSERSRALAATAGIEDVSTLENLVRKVDILLSILVPASAQDVARDVATAIRETGSTLLYVDCNAIAPRTVRTIGDSIMAVGAKFADVGIIGPPPTRPGTKFYASGPGAPAFADLRNYGLDVRLLNGDIGQASGLKMCYGAMTKGLQALGTELLVAARLMGLEEALRAEQRETMADVLAWVERSIPTMPPKAHRWVGEMEEIGLCLADLGMTPSILNGAAEMYRFVADTPIGRESPEHRDMSRDAAKVVAALGKALELAGPERQRR
jgi:3-hydroxyisobutyrate dehydrogenase-like beta-hydroxyacid dehydrogenase